MSIVTKTGDSGETGLIGTQRVSKADARMHAIGSLDELNALLGIVLTASSSEEFTDILTRLQNDLFTLGADLAALDDAMVVPRITDHHVHSLEQWIATLEESLAPLSAFILPGGSPLGARLHHARSVCRRTERWIVALEPSSSVFVKQYINRLSDLLFLLARMANQEAGAGEMEVKYVTFP